MGSICTASPARPLTGAAAAAGQVSPRSADGAAAPPGGHPGRLLGWLSAVTIGVTGAIMIGASLVRHDWMFPLLPMPASGPPWELGGVHVRPAVVFIALWAAAALGAVGLAAGLLAVRRGARPSARMLLTAGLCVGAVLTVLPPVGSSDVFDYAAYGRIAVLGHSPYLVPPVYLRHMHDAFALSVPRKWQHQVSVYGPLATAGQYLAARLGGPSMARVTFWLKLFNSAAFAAIALLMHRMLRASPRWRLRAHLLWTVNPLLLWVLVAAGHVDTLAVAAGLAGLLVLGRQPVSGKVSWQRAALAGAMVGAAAAIKIDYVLFAAGLAWALRKSAGRLAAAAGSLLAVLLPGYAWFGRPAITALTSRQNALSANSFYLYVVQHDKRALTHIGLIAAAAALILTFLLFTRMPPGPSGRPAMRLSLFLSAAWLFLWPYQLPWYDAMVICLLVFYLPTWLDWLVLVHLAAGALPNMTGNPWRPINRLAAHIEYHLVGAISPLLLFTSAAGLLILGLAVRRRKPEVVLRSEFLP